MTFKKYFQGSVFFTSLIALSLIAATGCTRAKKPVKAAAAAAKKPTTPESGAPAPQAGTPPAPAKPELNPETPEPSSSTSPSPSATASTTPVVAQPQTPVAPAVPTSPSPKTTAKNFKEWIHQQLETKAIEIDDTATVEMVKTMLESVKDQLPKVVTVDIATTIVMEAVTPDLREIALELISASLEKQAAQFALFSETRDEKVFAVKKASELAEPLKLKSEVLDQTMVLVPSLDHAQMKGPESELPSFRVLNLAAGELESIRFEYKFDPKKVMPNSTLGLIPTTPELKIKGLSKAFAALLKEKMGAPVVFVIQPPVLTLQPKTLAAAIKILEQQALDIQTLGTEKEATWISSTVYADDLKSAKKSLNLDEVVEQMEASKQATLKTLEFKTYLEARLAQGIKESDVYNDYSKRHEEQAQRYFPELNTKRLKHFYAAGVHYLQQEDHLAAGVVPAALLQPLLPAWNWSRTPGGLPTPSFVFDVLKD